ncbi:hypothetical protein MUG91_G45n235 [Manis pentadactyla]|nr:hypothetical protein MUG91_G45n235 [Manis pentadactyla]
MTNSAPPNSFLEHTLQLESGTTADAHRLHADEATSITNGENSTTEMDNDIPHRPSPNRIILPMVDSLQSLTRHWTAFMKRGFRGFELLKHRLNEEDDSKNEELIITLKSLLWLLKIKYKIGNHWRNSTNRRGLWILLSDS